MSNQQNERADALFEELSKNKKKKKRKIIRTVIIIVLVIAIALAAAVAILSRKVRERFATSDVEVLSYEATRDTISTTVSGSGVLAQVDLEQLTVPAGVEITDVLVEADDAISQGDVLATVDMASVMSAMSNLQAELDELDEEISDAKGDEVSSYIKAGVSGRVKVIYAQTDTSVASCMAENGALAVLSLDGYMAVDIETDELSKGDSVTVTLADGEEITGTVESAAGGKATVLVTDNGPAYGEEVTVASEDGTELGKGNLYIHSSLGITGYAGTVSTVSAKENQQVYSSSTLFTLKDTSSSANYDTLLRQREEKEETLMELLAIYRDGAVLAPMDGLISSVEYSGTSTEEAETSLLTIYPNVSMSVTIGIDETDILALEVGQEADVEVSSVSQDETYTGIVTEISKTASTSSGVTQYSAVVTLDKVEGMLPGMTASVDVKIEGVEDAIIIPLEALHQTSAISFVYTSYDEETQQYGGMVEVTTGMQNSNYVEITSGLSEGDTVYYTESQTFSFGFGGMGSVSYITDGDNMGGGMAVDFGGGSGGGMPSGDMGGGDRGNMGGNMPGGRE